MKDNGHLDDWGRFGLAGSTQRIQLRERPKVHQMKDAEIYRYKFSILIPDSVGIDFHTIAPFDFKDQKNG